ncbi:MAG: energy transducer TonB [Pseudomonadota bacterium]
MLRRRLIAGGLSVTLVLGLCALLALLQTLTTPNIEPMSLQRIDMAVALPPPPPPPTQRQRSETKELVQLELGEATSNALKLPPAKLTESFSVEDIQAPSPRMPPPQFDMNLNAAISEFGLAQLDGRPRLLTSLSIRFPESLKRQGINSVSIEAQVVIDQSGNVILRRLLKNPHKELEPAIRALIKRARFTPPEKDGRRVRAAFVWPLVLSAET